jgi:Zn-finger nucleic acid-binding protein
MQCPACPDVTLSMSNREGIEIDYCPKCRGVWLDRGELDKIIDRSVTTPPAAANATPPTDSRYAPGGYRKYDNDDDRYRHDKHYYGKRKRGLLGDIFDFD